MGVVFNTKYIVEEEVGRVHHTSSSTSGGSIKKQSSCPKRVIQPPHLKVLTPQNKQFLKSLSLRIRGKSAV